MGVNILQEFEKRYQKTGMASDTMRICEDIAREFGLDVDDVADYIYIHRYEDSSPLTDEEN
jgi:hypothetical protein